MMNKPYRMKRIAALFALLVLSAVTVSAQSDDKSTSKGVAAASSQDVKITQPEFKGGIEKMYRYISDNFEYPENAAKRSVNGEMEVEFTVEKSGDVTYCGIVKGLDYSIDDEILRLLKAMPRWTPATKNGEPVRYKVIMTLNVRASRQKNQRSSMAIYDYRDE